MKLLFSVLSFVFFVSACNNNRSSSASADGMSNVNPPIIVKDTQPVEVPVTLTSYEMTDDSVFKDGSIPTSWKNAGIDDVKGLKLFLKELQQRVMDNDKDKLAEVVQYPLKNIKSKEELISNYDKIFTKEVKLSFATINFNQLFRNQNGVMTDGGKVWIRQLGKDFKIIAINY